MRIKHLLEGLNAQQRSVPQLPAQARARKISVLGAKTDPKHPFAGYMVGADESAEPGRKRIGPDQNDPYEKGWRAQPDATNPYAAGTPEHSKWQDGRDERAAQPRHYDESVDDDMPDLEEVGEPVSSIMDAERRMAAGDRIFVAHEMDEEPFEVFNVGDLKGYTYDQMLAVPQGVAEEQLDEKCWDGYEKKGMKTMFGKRVPNCVKNEGEERNELDTPAVQAALARMAERHKGEKWSKEQLAALGKRIAARGQAKKGVDETVSTHKGGKITKTPTGIKHQAAPGNYGGYEPEFDHLRTLDKNTTGRIERSMDIKHKREKAWQGGIELDVDEGLKSKLAGAALAGAAALGGGGAAVAHDHGDYGHYDQRLDDRSWDTAGYDDHIKSDTKLTKTTTPDGKVSRDSQRRISSVQGPNAQGEYRVFVGQNGKIVSSYITKTPPQNWMVKEDVTKEDIITKLKARLGDYLSDLSKEIKSDPDLVDKLAAKAPGDQMGPPVKTVTTDDGHEIQIHGNEDDGFRISIKNKPAATQFKNLDEAVMACEMYCARRRKQTESADYVDEAGKDACYHKVKSRYKIWPSAYASGALVQCRKAGAANWGNKSKK